MFQPFGNHTRAPPAAWHPEPTFRGSYNVLSTCLFTMSLCIWTSVHLNLPEHKKQHLQFWRKTGWLVMGLLAPEIVAWNAWGQRREVKRLTRKMRDLHARRFHHPKAQPRCWQQHFRLVARKLNPALWCEDIRHRARVAMFLEPGELYQAGQEPWMTAIEKEMFTCPWTDTHSWYTIMGGFVFDTSNAEEPFLPEDRDQVVCSADGMILLADRWPHLVPSISGESIVDRSKSDGLAKFITCWQASWFCIQCIFRLSSGLSISLLELNVFGHAIAALCIYMIWWNKPKDIQEPTLIGENSPSSEVYSVAAMFSLLSPIGYAICIDPWPLPFPVDDDHMEAFLDYSAFFVWTPAEPNNSTRYLPPLPQAIYTVGELTETGSIIIRGGCWALVDIQSMVKNEVQTLQKIPFLARLLGVYGEQSRETTAQQLWQRQRAERLVAAKKTIQVCIDQRLATRLSMAQPTTLRDLLGNTKWKSPETLVRARNRNWCLTYTRIVKIPPLSIFSDVATVVLATSLYGGLHATAWNAAYPSEVELNLWRLSSLTVALTVLALVLGVVLAVFVISILSLPFVWLTKSSVLAPLRKWVSVAWESDKLRIAISFAAIALTFLLSSVVTLLTLAIEFIPIWYVFARVYLVVESFIGIAHLSSAELALPLWSSYVPHVT